MFKKIGNNTLSKEHHQINERPYCPPPPPRPKITGEVTLVIKERTPLTGYEKAILNRALERDEEIIMTVDEVDFKESILITLMISEVKHEGA